MLDVNYIKQELTLAGITVHRDMMMPTDVINGKAVAARTLKVDLGDNEYAIRYIIETENENFAFYKTDEFIFDGEKGDVFRFAIW